MKALLSEKGRKHLVSYWQRNRVHIKSGEVFLSRNWNLEIFYFIGVPGKGIQSSEKCNLIDINRKWGISISSANCNQFFEWGMRAVSLFLTHILGDTHDEAGATDSAVNGFGWSSLATNKDSPIEIYFASDARFV